MALIDLQERLDRFQNELQNAVEQSVRQEESLRLKSKGIYSFYELYPEYAWTEEQKQRKKSAMVNKLVELLDDPGLKKEPVIEGVAETLVMSHSGDNRAMGQIYDLVSKYAGLFELAIDNYIYCSRKRQTSCFVSEVLQSSLPEAAQQRNKQQAGRELLRLSKRKITVRNIQQLITRLELIIDTYLFKAYQPSPRSYLTRGDHGK